MTEKDHVHLNLLARKHSEVVNSTNPTIYFRLGITVVGIILQMAIQPNNHTVSSRSPVCGKNGTEYYNAYRSIFQFLILSSWQTATGLLAPSRQIRTLRQTAACGIAQQFLYLWYIQFRISQPGNTCKEIHTRQPIIIFSMYIKKEQMNQRSHLYPLLWAQEKIGYVLKPQFIILEPPPTLVELFIISVLNVTQKEKMSLL